MFDKLCNMIFDKLCNYCHHKLIKDHIGVFCPNEKCDSIDGEMVVGRNDKRWYKNNQLHRTNGPAVEQSDGSKYWYYKGQLHREDGPAIETNGHKAWYYKGLLHRENGAAIEYDDGSKEYWFNGRKFD